MLEDFSLIKVVNNCKPVKTQVLTGVTARGNTNLSELLHQLSIFSNQRRSSRSLILALRSSSITWRTQRTFCWSESLQVR